MAGTILGKDQVAKVNAAYPRIYGHIRGLIETAKDSVDLMRIHFAVDHIDTPELSAIFREIPFISPDERRALVRMAIYDTVTQNSVTHVEDPKTDLAGVALTAGPEQLKEFTPAPFKLNVATVNEHHV